MSGFCGVVAPDGSVSLPVIVKERSFHTIRYREVEVAESFISKFSNDKTLSVILDHLVCMDGVTLNSHELINSTAATSFAEAVASRYVARESQFLDELRGGFSGFVYDSIHSVGHLFTNHFGTKYLYYSQEPAPNGATYFSSSLLDVLDCLKDAGITPKLDKVAAYYLLTFGYMLDDRTLIEGVAKVEAGTSLKMKPGERPIKKYFYKYSNEEMVETCLDKAAQGLYEGLSLAVRAGFEKDREYGYSSVVLLSGGLDSRMNCFFAHHLGFRDVLTLTFGQSNCIDEKIASTIARDLGFEHLFHQLDGGNFLWKALRSCIAVNDGLILFAGSAHAVSTYEMINWGKYGLLHNGNLADVSQGDYVDSNKHYAPEASVWAYSKDLLGRIGPEIEKVLARYPNQEAFAIATRGINAVLNGSVSAQGLTETDEPFLYPELVDFASRLPARYKNGERAFLTMIERYFPEAARYPWQKWGRLPTVANLDRGGKLYSRVFRHGHRFLEKGAARVAGKPDPADMNPFDHWMRTSPGFKRFFSDSRESVARFAENHSELGVDALQLFDKGNVIEKTQAMTLVAAAERLGLA